MDTSSHRHEQDVTTFSPLLAHRLPTVSASQALEELKSSSSSCRRPLTGLNRLDSFSHSKDGLQGVICRGQITEIYGPPGVGKTAFA
ncbi:MAG: hypothetical protein M1816_000163 [Peltula sp. TS41687]|nr:MAG: hypothetical protein M1816_000163 [Peltula sp. TS41687]